MATLTTLLADPDALLSPSDTFLGLVPPVNLAGSVDAIDQSAGSATLRLLPYSSVFGTDFPGIYAKLIGTGLTYAPGEGLPVGGLVTSIEFGAYIFTGGGFGQPPAQFVSLGITHRLDFATPISAADLYATGYDLTTLFYGGADSMVGASVGADSLLGYAGNDTIDGSGGDDTLDGGADNDVLTGGAGDDSLLGGEGNDMLRPAAGEDSVFGGAGADTILVSDSGGNPYQPEGDVLNGGTGTDVLLVSTAAAGVVHLNGATFAGLETLRIESGMPWLTRTQLNGFFSIELATGAGSVTNIGVIGHGAVVVGALTFPQTTAAGMKVFLATDGTPGTAFTYLGRDSGSTFANDDVLGSLGNDSVQGQGGNDTLNGSGGGDTLLGGDGADRLIGQNDADSLSGGAGNDTLLGGAGVDTLSGGANADRFAFTNEDLATQGQTDRITDFTPIQFDRIDLSGIDANAGVAGDQAFSAPAVLLGTAAPPPAGSLRYEVKRDHVLLSLYTDSDAVADFLIRVGGSGWTPGAADFVL